jgi:hypothetical protein
MSADADVPEAFLRALISLRERRLRPEVVLEEIPAPARIAPYAVALNGDVPPEDDSGADTATGRFVFLHDPDGQEAWQGVFRVVTLVRANLDAEIATDPLLCEAAWTWVQEALADADARYTALGGTVTLVQSQSFGALTERPDEVEIEIRASWTPDGSDAGTHLAAWSTLLCTSAGLPPLPDGVTSLGRRL